MTCERMALPGGGIAIVCTRGARRKRCSVCGLYASKACDWKLTGKRAGKTCDKALCHKCAAKVAPDKDLCPAHARAWAEHPKNPKRHAPPETQEEHDARRLQQGLDL